MVGKIEAYGKDDQGEAYVNLKRSEKFNYFKGGTKMITGRFLHLGMKIFVMCWVIFWAACTGSAFGADFPTKPITLLCPYAAGGPVDITGRSLAEVAKEILGQPVVVINKAGGGGIIAQSIVAKEKPDGYNLAISSIGAFTQIPQMREVSFDPLKDFEFIIQHMTFGRGVACRAEKPWKSLIDLVAYSKQYPGQVTYGCEGAGSNSHINTMIIATKEGVKWEMVPFDGSIKVTAALLGGHVDFLLTEVTAWKPHVKTGELRALAVERIVREDFPGVVTVEEMGIELAPTSFGIVAPKGTPADIIKKLHDGFKRAIEDPRYEATCKKLGAFKIYFSGEEFSRLVKSEYEKRTKMLKELGLAKGK